MTNVLQDGSVNAPRSNSDGMASFEVDSSRIAEIIYIRGKTVVTARQLALSTDQTSNLASLDIEPNDAMWN